MTPATASVDVAGNQCTGRCRTISPSCSRRTRCSPGTRSAEMFGSACCSRACPKPNARRVRAIASKPVGLADLPTTIPPSYQAACGSARHWRERWPRNRHAAHGRAVRLRSTTDRRLRPDLSGPSARSGSTIVSSPTAWAKLYRSPTASRYSPARPGTIKQIIAVDEPHPRKPDFVTSEKFTKLRNELYSLLHDEIRKAVSEAP